jgi:toxin-antitoxin system PIN domain toxin
VNLPWNWLIARGLIRYGYREQAALLLTRLISAILKSLAQEHTFRRAYHADTGAGSGEYTALSGSAPVGLPWPSLLGFLRIVTNPRVFEQPEPISEAWDQVAAWLACESAWIPQPGERHVEILASLLADPGVRANLVPDAHLAALAIEHGLLLHSTDGDFARFASLRWSNPLRT